MTASTLPRLDAEFTTLDGLTLRGWLFPTSKRGPAMIMSPGFTGAIPSWKTPLNVYACAQINARQRAEHLHDAVTWFKENPLVDETKIAPWGLCLGGNVTLAAAAFDNRVAAAISVAPLIDPTGNPERRQPILELAMHDRASRLAGEEPMYLPYVKEDGSIPNGLQLPAEMMPALDRPGIPVENRISVQNYT
ncbi:hypothetical protein CFD26_100402 [Aspergillus turcosus]|uniref:Dienelactone hydrolase domain-containing protein n=1 Tax=Aspergillus turcosus TaxID=1245748 RepID=A0A421CUD2_9EURO|nr:hypothetical protein CFD26_100402 [Aspergillus turcosus]